MRQRSIDSLSLWVSLGIAVASVIGAAVMARGAGAFAPDRALPLANIFDPVGSHARIVERLGWLVTSVAGVIFLVVGGLIAYTVVRFRERGDEKGEPAQVYGSNAIELAWTVVPVILVIVLGMASVRTIWQLEHPTDPPEAIHVRVIGHQWWWEFEYTDHGFTTANELHVPTSEPGAHRPVLLTLQSADVVHSFWVPQLAGKVDLVPNKTNRLWIDAEESGTYTGQCAEYCGTQHAKMLLRVVAQPVAEFESWVEAQKRPANASDEFDEGRRVFLETACLNCHTVRGTVANGRFGPDLTHFMDRRTLGAGAGDNTAENLEGWIADPSHLKPGVMMPAMQLDEGARRALVAYLRSLD